jgi:hypothetical protein
MPKLHKKSGRFTQTARPGIRDAIHPVVRKVIEIIDVRSRIPNERKPGTANGVPLPRAVQAEADAVLLGRVTQHWIRHMLATRLLRKDPRAAMEQGGWLDIRSVIGYAQDVPEHRR